MITESFIGFSLSADLRQSDASLRGVPRPTNREISSIAFEGKWQPISCQSHINGVLTFSDLARAREMLSSSSTICRNLTSCWRSPRVRPGVSKVQYRMNLIDATGTQLGSALPQLPAKDNPEKLRGTHIRTMAYNLPRSGKACSQDFVCDVLHSVRRATNAVCLGATSHQIRPPLGLHSGATGASIWSGCRGRALASARWARCCDSRRCRSEQGPVRLARYRGVSWCNHLLL